LRQRLEAMAKSGDSENIMILSWDALKCEQSV
jgi:hypothetical protein